MRARLQWCAGRGDAGRRGRWGGVGGSVRGCGGLAGEALRGELAGLLDARLDLLLCSGEYLASIGGCGLCARLECWCVTAEGLGDIVPRVANALISTEKREEYSKSIADVKVWSGNC